MAVNACEAVLLDLLAQVRKFCEEQGEAEFETGAAEAMKRQIVGQQAEPHMQRQLDRLLVAYGVTASHPLSVMCGCAKCQATFKAEADARGVPVLHVLSHETTGSGNMECITPICTCGWRGVGRYAHSDTQLGDVARDEQQHLRAQRGTA